MAWTLFVIGGFVLSGIIDSEPVFGASQPEVDMVLGLGLWVFAFAAWVVERFTDDRGAS